MSFHIIVPAHNESENLASCIQTLRALYPNATITIAEDGSTDETKATAYALAQQSKIFLQSYPERLGKGAAIKLALLEGYVNAYVDADISVNPTALKPMMEILQAKGGLVIAKRLVMNRSFKRTITSTLYNILVRIMFRTGISDHQCGCKLLSPEATDIALTVEANDFFFDTELIVRCKKAHIPIIEIIVTWTEYKTKSTVNIFKDGSKMFIELLKLKNRGEVKVKSVDH